MKSLRRLGSLRRSVSGQSRWSHREARLEAESAPLVVREAKTAHVAPHEVRVRVDSAGVNNADLNIIRGRHHLRPPLPFVPGFELAGEVAEVGKGVSRLKEGDRVLGLRTSGMGGWSEEAVLAESELVPIPYRLSYEAAAALPVAYCSALLALRGLKADATVLVLTSQGSTGLGAIDIAQNLYKCQVIGASDTEAKCAEIRSRGVLATLDYQDENMVKKVMKLTDGKGVDVVVDTVGGPWFDLALKCLKAGGRLSSLGFSSGSVPTLSLQELIRRQISVQGCWLGGFASTDPEGFHNIISKVVEYVDERFLSPVPGYSFPLDQVNEAVAAADWNVKKLGKVILTLRSTPPPTEN